MLMVIKMANDFMTPKEAAKLMTKVIKDAAKESGLPPEREAELACAVFGGLFKGPTTAAALPSDPEPDPQS